jgi:hypothetical protein
LSLPGGLRCHVSIATSLCSHLHAAVVAEGSVASPAAAAAAAAAATAATTAAAVHLGLGQQACEAEVGDLEHSREVEEQVGWLEVAVYDRRPARVQVDHALRLRKY